MVEIINFRQAKKTQRRAEKRAAGDENAARFGRSKALKGLEQARAEKARALLDGHFRDPDQTTE